MLEPDLCERHLQLEGSEVGENFNNLYKNTSMKMLEKDWKIRL